MESVRLLKTVLEANADRKSGSLQRTEVLVGIQSFQQLASAPAQGDPAWNTLPLDEKPKRIDLRSPEPGFLSDQPSSLFSEDEAEDEVDAQAQLLKLVAEGLSAQPANRSDLPASTAQGQDSLALEQLLSDTPPPRLGVDGAPSMQVASTRKPTTLSPPSISAAPLHSTQSHRIDLEISPAIDTHKKFLEIGEETTAASIEEQKPELSIPSMQEASVENAADATPCLGGLRPTESGLVTSSREIIAVLGPLGLPCEPATTSLETLGASLPCYFQPCLALARSIGIDDASELDQYLAHGSVDALEAAITKAFGATTSSGDILVLVMCLEQYARKHLGRDTCIRTEAKVGQVDFAVSLEDPFPPPLSTPFIAQMLKDAGVLTYSDLLRHALPTYRHAYLLFLAQRTPAWSGSLIAQLSISTAFDKAYERFKLIDGSSIVELPGFPGLPRATAEYIHNSGFTKLSDFLSIVTEDLLDTYIRKAERIGGPAAKLSPTADWALRRSVTAARAKPFPCTATIPDA